MLLLLACTPSDSADTAKDSAAVDSGETGDTTDTPDTTDSTETAHTGDTGPDTGDTAPDTDDTGDPSAFTVTTYTPPEAFWYGLSVAPDGAVWGATTVGLVRLLPDTGEVTPWTSADGLTTDTPTSVLAASDGTVWVGHVYDSTRQGEQVLADGADLFVLQPIDYTATTEITSLYRLQEQPYGVGVGDVWMGANEGINVWDADLRVFDEHAHPTHPHGNTLGIAFTPDGDEWNLDQYQVSRWNYSNDGDLSASADLVEYWQAWPVALEETIAGTDADADDWTLWLTSSLFGVARVDVGLDPGTSTTSFYTEPVSANAVRVGPDGTVWVGAEDGLYRYDGAQFVREDRVPTGPVTQLAADDDGVWAVIGFAVVRLTGVP